jgi:hypothetical protein
MSWTSGKVLSSSVKVNKNYAYFSCGADHFDYFYREYDEFVFPMTIHPDVSGRPHVLLMHERYTHILVDHSY